MPGSKDGSDILAEKSTLAGSLHGPGVTPQHHTAGPASYAGEDREVIADAEDVEVPADEGLRDRPLHPKEALEVWLTAARHLISGQPDDRKPSEQQLVAVALEGNDSPVARMYTAFVRNCNAERPDLHMLFGLAFAGNALALDVLSKRLVRKRKQQPASPEAF